MKNPIVSIRVITNGLTESTILSTMGDTTHVQTELGTCFHIGQLTEDSVYFEPAKRILQQSKDLVRLEQQIREKTIRLNAELREMNRCNTPAERFEQVDYVMDAQKGLDEAQNELELLQMDISLQTQKPTKVLNMDGTSEEI